MKSLPSNTSARTNAKSLPKSAGIIQRKRTRSEIADEGPNTVRVHHSPPFPGRVPPSRRPKLDINLLNMPRVDGENIPEVFEGCLDDMLLQEEHYAADPDYLDRQEFLNARMRAVLLDWMFEVGQEYGLKRDTLHYSINYVDRYLTRQTDPVERNVLQLVGVTALWIASKMEEILPPPVSDFAAATDGGCSIAQIIEMEGKMLEGLDWDLLPCTAFAFANLYLQRIATMILSEIPNGKGPDQRRLWMMESVVSHLHLTRVMEILDLGMLDIDSLCFSPSVLAATAIHGLVQRSQSEVKPEHVLMVSGKSLADLTECIQWLDFAFALQPGDPKFVHRLHVLESNLPQELHLVQRHHTEAILMYRSAAAAREGRRHAAAERYQRSKLERNSVASPEEAEDELIYINRQYANVQNEGARPLTPLTHLSRVFETAAISELSTPRLLNPGRHLQAMQRTSPQRRMKFEEFEVDER